VLVGRYALQHRLGGSGIGDCWRATDTVLDRAVVVKLIDPSLAADPAFVERLNRGLRMVALASHQGIARLLDTGEDEGTLFVVREYVEGESLRELVVGAAEIAVADATWIVRSALEAVAAANEAGVLHLDMKPENVIVGPDGTIKVCDLGLGHAVVDTRPPDDAAAILAPTRLAPELRAGESPDGRADVWGCGALLFEILSGRPPENESQQRTGLAEVPRRLDDAVARALQPDPAGRFESAGAFARALREIPPEVAAPRWGGGDADRGSGQRTLPPPPRPSSIFRTWLAVPMLVILLILCAGAVGLWAGKIQLGGPVGIRFNEGSSPSPAPHVVAFTKVAPFDPYGDGQENTSNLPLAADNNTDTVWKSEAYRYPNGGLGKPGVGILFFLNGEQTVLGFRLQTPYPGYRFTVVVGDDPNAMVAAAKGTYTATSNMHEDITPATGRYVLLWITSVVPTDDGNRAEVGEFRVVGPA
jgi:hypothetical protein